MSLFQWVKTNWSERSWTQLWGCVGLYKNCIPQNHQRLIRIPQWALLCRVWINPYPYPIISYPFFTTSPLITSQRLKTSRELPWIGRVWRLLRIVDHKLPEGVAARRQVRHGTVLSGRSMGVSWDVRIHMGVSINGTPKWMVYGENPIKIWMIYR